ncbi:MAG: dihydrolipoyl dehydrogenase [Actinomycetes bacterium]
MADEFDLIVIGSGPGGYVAAIRSAQLGHRTAVIEREHIGGRCLNKACIPAKAVLRVADVLQEVREAGDYGIEVGEPKVDQAKVAERRDSVISTLVGGVNGLMKKNEIEVVEGTATLTGNGGITVGDRNLTAPRIILATGSVRKPLPGLDFGDGIVGTEEAWALEAAPARLAVIGAGASGAEIASAYARLGSTVTLIEALDRVLPSEDADISKAAGRGFKKQGIDVLTGNPVSNVEQSGGVTTLTVGDKTLEADLVVIAAGRGPDVEGLGLDAAGVKLDERGLIEIDGNQKTSADGIWAIGDLVRGPALAHKASEEGIIAVEAASGMAVHPLDLDDIPRATFCYPNVASFGLTEQQAKDAGHDVVVGKVQYGAVGAGTVYGDRTGIVKIIGDRKYGELLGGHICGAKAPELIQELVNAKALEGGYPEIARIIHGHPTLSEAISEAARAADGWLIHG